VLKRISQNQQSRHCDFEQLSQGERSRVVDEIRSRFSTTPKTSQLMKNRFDMAKVKAKQRRAQERLEQMVSKNKHQSSQLPMNSSGVPGVTGVMIT